MNTLLFVLKSHFPHVLLSCKRAMCLTDCDFKELLLGTKYFIINNIIIIRVGKGEHACYSVCMEARGQLCGIGSLLPFVGPRHELRPSACAAPLPAGPSHQPLLLLYLEQSLPCTPLIPAFRKQRQMDLCVNERHS